VSLPPPNNLSCSPKQLDSGYNIHELRFKKNNKIFKKNMCFVFTKKKTWLSHSKAAVRKKKEFLKLQKIAFQR
jgi:hypothetical protein